MNLRIGSLLLAVLAAANATVAAVATSQPAVSAELGFGGVYKPDAWSPLYVRLSTDTPRPVTIELRTTRGRAGQVVAAHVIANPQPTTFTLYAPPIGPLDRVVVQLYDERGRLLRDVDLTEESRATPAAFGGPVFGVAADEIGLAQNVASRLFADSGEQLAAGAIRTRVLPDQAIGYETLDVLVLPELNTDTLDDDIEQAILRWTRAGGLVIAWPGAAGIGGRSPLADVLPATVGPFAEQPIDGRAATVRTLIGRDGAVDRSRGQPIFERRIGLGQIVLCSVDPSTLGTTPADRVASWRHLTSNHLRLLNEERLTNLFDALVARSRGEQALAPVAMPGDWRPWLWAGLALCLVMGPGELILLAAARRHPRTPVTVLGLLGTVGFAIALASVGARSPSTPGPQIAVTIETDTGACVTATVGHNVPIAATPWIAGDILDPLKQPAGEIHIRQVAGDVAAMDSTATRLLPLQRDALPAIRSIAFDNTPAAFQWDDRTLRSESDHAWSSIAVATPFGFTQIGDLPAGGSLQVPTPADVPATLGRRRTGIEQLAEQDGWSAVLMDRWLASRLVALQEHEGATIVAARRETADGPRYLLHVRRR